MVSLALRGSSSIFQIDSSQRILPQMATCLMPQFRPEQAALRPPLRLLHRLDPQRSRWTYTGAGAGGVPTTEFAVGT